MFPEKPVLWLSQSLEAPSDRADTVENISIRVVAVIVSCKFYNKRPVILTVRAEIMGVGQKSE